MLFIEQKEAARLLTVGKCIDLMKGTLISLAEGRAIQPLRNSVTLGDGRVLGLMPAYLVDENIVGSKIITVFPENHVKGLPSHQGVVILFDAITGSIKAVIDAMVITAIRTAAISAVATDILANKYASSLAILGTGTQGATHFEAMLHVRDIRKVTVWDYYYESAQRFAKKMAEKHKVKVDCCQNVKEAIADADIICTVTLASEPILNANWLKQGVHINAVGACTPTTREIDTLTVVKSNLYVDKLESAVNEAGCYLIPLAEGVINDKHIVGEIGDVLVGRVDGRKNENEITLFKSLGLAVEDLAAANFIYKEAIRK